MIAPRVLSHEFQDWNRKHAAPFGRQGALSWLRGKVPWRFYLRMAGPFSVQENNTTRLFEYPWAFLATPVTRGLRVLEIGGGLSGFQFVLDKSGCTVVNIDPGLEAKGGGWPCDLATVAKLNRLYGTSVDLRNTTINRANLAPSSFNRVFSISVLEHLLDEERDQAMSIAFSCLKPGGYLIATIDLFLNLSPFTSRKESKYGRNIDVRRLLEAAPFKIVKGDPKELNGYPEFDADRIQSNLENYFIGQYPTLIQCVLLQKPE